MKTELPEKAADEPHRSYVVDASVVVKWFLPETESAEALELRGGKVLLLAPDFLQLEVGNVLWKRVRQGSLSEAEAVTVLGLLYSAPLVWVPAAILLPSAFEFACRIGLTVYDSIYLALTLHRSSRLVTADEKLHKSLKGTQFDGKSVLLREISAVAGWPPAG